jgi:hypothetical protein
MVQAVEWRGRMRSQRERAEEVAGALGNQVRAGARKRGAGGSTREHAHRSASAARWAPARPPSHAALTGPRHTIRAHATPCYARAQGVELHSASRDTLTS